jgi:hypothetical protein
MTTNSKYHSEWYSKNSERLLPFRRIYNKEYFSKPENIERARINNARPEVKAKRKAYKKTVEGRKNENKYRRKQWAKIGSEKHLIQRYGINKEDYEFMLSKQNGVCVICKRDKQRLLVDHCHKNGHVRGLLCTACNMGLGLFKDDKDLLLTAIEYLKTNGIH